MHGSLLGHSEEDEFSVYDASNIAAVVEFTTSGPEMPEKSFKTTVITWPAAICMLALNLAVMNTCDPDFANTPDAQGSNSVSARYKDTLDVTKYPTGTTRINET
jgi:hypothetical protein